ncbi:hypothetical protein LY76DRAFT_179891 [Colletotrichum caudatum]|nr:hypothetical protein LY76DRAFT_179891 [Colletotrichum caudatum]
MRPSLAKHLCRLPCRSSSADHLPRQQLRQTEPHRASLVSAHRCSVRADHSPPPNDQPLLPAFDRLYCISFPPSCFLDVLAILCSGMGGSKHASPLWGRKIRQKLAFAAWHRVMLPGGMFRRMMRQ